MLQPLKAINDSLNSEEFKEGVIRELRSNSDTPIDERDDKNK